METLLLLSKIFGLSFTSGINLYATVGLVGLAIRFNLIHNLPEQLNVLANEYVIGTALVMYICEFVADKIPAFDSFWDSIHTFIRPFAAAYIALMAAGDAPMTIKVIAMLIAGSIALTSHTAKAGIRLAANTSPEPFSNSILSIAEDIGVLTLVVLIFTHPLIAGAIILLLLTLIIWQGPKLVSFIFFTIKSIYFKIKSYLPFEKFVNVEILPEKHNKYLNSTLNESEKVYLTIGSIFKGLKKGSGYLVVSENRCLIIHKSWFRIKHLDLDLKDIKRMTFQSNFLTDRISLSHNDKQLTMILFKSNNRSIEDIRNIFKSLDVETIDPTPEISLSKAKTV